MRRLATFTLLCFVLSVSAASAADAGSTLLVSRPDGTGAAPPALDNDASTPGALSADGRYAVFASDADGLDPAANPRVQNLYLRDRQAQTTTLVSRSDGQDGAGMNSSARNPAIVIERFDGHVLVAFESATTNTTDHDTGAVIANPHHVSQIWLRDVDSGTTTLVSRATGMAGAAADESSRNPAIADSAGGPLVVFDTQASNLGANGVLLRTIRAHTTQQVSCPKSDCTHPGPSDSFEPDIKVVPADKGRCSAVQNPFKLDCVHVAFASHDKSIFNSPQSIVWNATAVAPIVEGFHPADFSCCSALSRTSTTLANQDARKPTFSGDGLSVAFLSSATNLGVTVPAGVQQAWLRGLGGPTLLLSRSTGNGDPADRNVDSVSLSGTVTNFTTLAGARAVFQTSATNIGGSGAQTYVRDVKTEATSTTNLLNRPAGPGAVAGDGESPTPPAISADGSVALFGSDSKNLDDGQAGRFAAVHARQLDTNRQEVDLVSRSSGSDRITPSGSDMSSFDASHRVVSATGRYVAFDSQSDSLSPIDDNRSTNVFVRDLLTNRTILVTRATGGNGVPADGASSVAGISADGQRVAFTSLARNLDPDSTGTREAYVRDLAANTTTLVSRGAGGTPAVTGARAEAISGDGNSVVVTSDDPLDPAGAGGVQHAYVRDLSAETTTLADRDSGADGKVPDFAADSPVINADGSRVAWGTVARLSDAPDVPKTRVYVRDLRTHETTFVSRANGTAGAAADGPSYHPAINAAGDVVAFASESPNLGGGLGTPQVFVRDIARGQTELVSRAADGGPQLPAEADSPSIDASGNRVAFVADGAIDAPPISVFGAYVRDRAARTTKLVGRADGAAGLLADADASAVSISGSGECVAFTGPFTNIGDGFASSDFPSVHLRVLSGTCPRAEPTGGPEGPGGSDGPGGGTTKPGDNTTKPEAPVLTGLKLSPNRVRSGRKTAIVFSLSRAARVTITFERLTKGHRSGRRCVARGRGKPCTIVTRAGTLTVDGRTGANKVKFSGKLKGKALRTGRYQLTATPLLGRAHTTKFAVVAAPKKRS
jgi:Tol biopolymer transport system component